MFVLIIQSCYHNLTMENVRISEICGLCAGCKNAIDTASNLSKKQNVTLYKEIVHNKNVNLKLKNLGILTTNNLKEVSPETHLILRAHGEPPETYEYLKANKIPFTDCTCKNVTKIHDLVKDYSKKGYKIIILGKYGKSNNTPHPEVLGTIGWCQTTPILIEDSGDISQLHSYQDEKFYLVCQTTFNEAKADELINLITVICKTNNNQLIINKSICYAQKSINIASVKLAKTCDIMIVVGGKNSSNSLELFNNVKSYTNSIFIEDISTWLDELTKQNFTFNKSTKFGITAGASTQKEELILLKDLIETTLAKMD